MKKLILLIFIMILLSIQPIVYSSSHINYFYQYDEKIVDYHHTNYFNFDRYNKELNSINENKYFNDTSNSSVFIVRVSSQDTITLKNMSYIYHVYSNGEHTIAGCDYFGCFITNGSFFSIFSGASGWEVFKHGSLRYLRYKLGNIINYTYDNRSKYQIQDKQLLLISGSNTIFENYTFDPGTWYFIFTGTIFDLNQDEFDVNLSVWMNFTDYSADLEISSYEGGRVYGLAYNEFNANLIRSEAHTKEIMFNGRAEFDIENQFFYKFLYYPCSKGFWYIFWKTPTGSKSFNAIYTEDEFYFDEDKVDGCVYGIGGPGHYFLSTSYLDLIIPEKDNQYAWPVYFIGFDIKLR